MGVESAKPQSCSGAAYFDPRSTSKHRSWMAIDFTSAGEPLKLVLGNWVASPRSSVWWLRQVRIIDRTTAVRAVSDAKKYAATASPLVPTSALVNFSALYTWSFRYKVPGDWKKTPGVLTRRRDSSSGQSVQTNYDRYGYVFHRLIRLHAGEYVLRLNGRVLTGGLSIGAESIRTKKWIAQRFYWDGQTDQNGVMALRFHLEHDETIMFAIANWTISPGKSRWLVRGIELDNLR
jgi:hypothetical protein